MPTETEKAYLAGLIDGEGHIGITLARQGPNGYWHTHVVIVTIANTYMAVLTWVKDKWGGILVIRNQPKQKIPIGNLRWSSSSAIDILKNVLPYLQIKKAQAMLALQFGELIEDREKSTKFISEEEWNIREELRMSIRQLNRKDATLKIEPYPVGRYLKKCATCGKEFHSGGSTKKYCSDHCRYKDQWKRYKEKHPKN